MEGPVLHFVTNWPVLFLLTTLTIIAYLGLDRVKNADFLMWCVMLISSALLSARIGFSLWDVKTTVLSLSIPLAGLAGLGVRALDNLLNSFWRHFAHWALVISLVGGIVGASLAFPGLIYSGHIYLRPSDLLVMNWIENNLPTDALFVVNALQFDWSPGWMIGSDAGYWIPLLSNRGSVMLPMVYFMEWVNPVAIQRLEQIYQVTDSREGGIADSRCSTLKKYNITHIFTSFTPDIHMPTSMKLTCIRVCYRQDHRWVFELTP